MGLGGVRWGGGEPGFGGPAAAVAARCALEAAGFFEDGEGAVDLAGLLVAAEEVADLGRLARMHAAPTAELWRPDTPAIDWTSFETASEAGADILARLAGDRSLLRRLVFKGPSRDEFWSRTAASDDGGFISLHDDRQRGIHLFLHLGTQHHQGETCEQRYSYVCRVIAGA